MSKAYTSTTPHAPAKRRTVLMSLHYGIENRRRGVYDAARRAGWKVLDLEYYNREVPRTVRPDGVLFQLHLATEEAMIARRFLRLGIPAVQIEDFALPEKFCCVVEDRRAVGRAAAEHFADRGFRNMAYLGSEVFHDSPFRLIGESFIARARDLGARAELIAIQSLGRLIPWARVEALAKRFEREISGFQFPLGIFTYHDTMAARICQFCDALGLSVPEQVAVLGYGNDPCKCDFASTPLSSVAPNYYDQGRIAAELLDRLMDGQPAPAGPVLVAPAGIVTRQSTDVLALPDLDTARALRYMWEHFAEPLSVDNIADAAAISRRKLERHFQTYLHRGVSEELVRKRLERACELLVATRTRVKVISEQVGFTTEKHFFRSFRKVMGTSPRQYRLAHAAKLREAENDEND